MSAGIMAASANSPTPTPELLRCNAKVIRRCTGRRSCCIGTSFLTSSQESYVVV